METNYWVLFSMKDLARDALAHLVPDPEASLLQGVLLGIRSGIPEDLYEDYNTTGTSHIIVISGSNKPANTIIAFGATRAFSVDLEGQSRSDQAELAPRPPLQNTQGSVTIGVALRM